MLALQMEHRTPFTKWFLNVEIHMCGRCGLHLIMLYRSNKSDKTMRLKCDKRPERMLESTDTLEG